MVPTLIHNPLKIPKEHRIPDLQSIEARVSSVLSPEHDTDPEQELSEANLVELLQQLDNADGAMTGVEEKLNNVLGQLDNLLAVLERKDDSEAGENSKSDD
ncbi:hypothetical protein MPER_04622 [Moniliophthora perniciosa FA553]|nr:hypothetical protein MPER_04622 [Moniliophthora perniciosa FA553]